MICSDNSRCKKFNLIEVDNMFVCKNCKAIFNKPFKIFNCYKKDLLIENQIFHIAKILKNLLMYKYFLKTNRPYLAA